MSALLWTLVASGAWNVVGLLERAGHGAHRSPYYWHIAMGVWAAAILLTQ